MVTGSGRLAEEFAVGVELVAPDPVLALQQQRDGSAARARQEADCCTGQAVGGEQLDQPVGENLAELSRGRVLVADHPDGGAARTGVWR